MNTVLTTLEKTLGQQRLKKMEPLKNYTSFRVGGPAEYFVALDTIEDIVAAVKTAEEIGLSVTVFGGGSNVLFSHNGIQGLVIKNNCRKIELHGFKGKIENRSLSVNHVQVVAEAGAIMNQLVRFTIDQGLSGLEYQLGLPGTVGGGVYTNANYTKRNIYVGEHLASAVLLSSDGTVREVPQSYFRFTQDSSTVKQTGEVVLSATFLLKPMDKALLWKRGKEAVEYRTSTMPKGAEGCTFRNIGLAHAFSFSATEEEVSGEYLIEKAGLKGKRIGDAMVAESSTHFIVNCGEATTHDVISLMTLIKREVKHRFGVELKIDTTVLGN